MIYLSIYNFFLKIQISNKKHFLHHHQGPQKILLFWQIWQQYNNIVYVYFV